MRDYEELVKRLRELPHLLFVQLHGHEDVVYQAADAIGELQEKIEEFYYLVQDVNRNEIMGHISENNLDSWLYSFQRYAARIARKPLPQPPKEET